MEKCPEENCHIRSLDRKQSPANQKKDLIVVTRHAVYPEEYHSIYFIKCNKCGLNFEVKEDPGFHTPQYEYPSGI